MIMLQIGLIEDKGEYQELFLLLRQELGDTDIDATLCVGEKVISKRIYTVKTIADAMVLMAKVMAGDFSMFDCEDVFGGSQVKQKVKGGAQIIKFPSKKGDTE